jgi:prepilin signal peptidase PulO-like enzyme (type II secretory pathway)
MPLPVPTVIFSLLLFAFGTILGSFLNVVTLRYAPEGRLFSPADIGGRSRCPHCKKTLAWYELIPLLSFLVQRGECRSCSARLSFQYPALECAAGLVVAGVPAVLISFWSVSPQLFFLLQAPWWSYVLAVLWIAISLLLLVVLVVDLRHLIIPNGLNLAIGIVGACVTAVLALAAGSFPPFRESFLAQYQLLLSPFSMGAASVLLNHLIGAIVGWGLFFLLHLIARGRAMGMGDVKLALALGLALGWPDIGLAIALSFIIGGAWGAFALIFRARRFGDRVPFGPFLVLGALLTLALGSSLMGWYFGFFTA